MNILSSIIHLETKEDRQLIYDAVIYAIEYLYETQICSSYKNEAKVIQYAEYTKAAKIMQEKFPDILH
jgi:hypothetical protein